MLLNYGVKICRVIPCLISIIIVMLVSNDTMQVTIYGYIVFIWGVCACFGLGLGIGASTRIGNLLGANKSVQSKQSAILIIIFGFLVSIIISLILAVFSSQSSFILLMIDVYKKVCL